MYFPIKNKKELNPFIVLYYKIKFKCPSMAYRALLDPALSPTSFSHSPLLQPQPTPAIMHIHCSLSELYLLHTLMPLFNFILSKMHFLLHPPVSDTYPAQVPSLSRGFSWPPSLYSITASTLALPDARSSSFIWPAPFWIALPGQEPSLPQAFNPCT